MATTEQVQDLLSQVVRVGFVVTRNPATLRVRVECKDTVTSALVSDWLPVLTPRAGQDKQYDLPDVGEQVLCLFLPHGREKGFVLGSMFAATPAPVSDGDKWHRTFKDGTSFEYDRNTNTLAAKIAGSGVVNLEAEGPVNVKAKGPISLESSETITLKAPSIVMKGNLTQTNVDGGPASSNLSGTFKVRQGDVIAESVSLVNHAHTDVEAGSDNSGPPSAGGGGTDIPNSGNEKGGLTDVRNMVEATEENFITVFGESSPDCESIKDFLLCLPDIAQLESENSDSENDKVGWLQLRTFLQRWFLGAANNDAESNSEAYWVDLDWLFSYDRICFLYNKFLMNETLLNGNAQDALTEILRKDSKFTDKQEVFDYTDPRKFPASKDRPWQAWKDKYFQRLTVDRLWILPIDGITASLGNFDLRMLAKGFVTPLPDGGHRVTVDSVSMYLWDSFNFDKEDELGYWSCKKKLFKLFDPDDETFMQVYNSHFHMYRNNEHKGQDFMVLSEPKKIDYLPRFEYVTDL